MPTTNGKKQRDIGDLILEFRGDRLTLPEGMSHDEAIEVIQRKKIENETEVNVTESVRCFPLDGAVAFAKVLKNRYGWANLVPTDSFFGPQRPSIIAVEVGYNEKVQVPWGQCSVPKIDGLISTGFEIAHDMPTFAIHACVKRKHEHMISEIAQEVRELVQQESIYRHKAIKINFRDNAGDRFTHFEPTFAPRFVDLNSIHVKDIIYSRRTSDALQTNVFNLVEHTDKCRKYNIPLKRGILLEGQFGTGKTLTADLLAKKCVENGWTFLYLEDSRDLDMALSFAELYPPCVLFCEDIDKALKGDRNATMDRLFNKMDGLEGKMREVMVVLTTNTLGTIHPGFLRPGRIDTVIEITPPDAQAMARLVRLYGRDDTGASIVNTTDEEIAGALRKINGVNAAFIREVVERAKLAALSREGEHLEITHDDLRIVADALEPHIQILYPHLEKGDPFVNEGEEIEPMKLAGKLLMNQFATELLNMVVDPKTLQKIVLKKMPPKPRGFSNN